MRKQDGLYLMLLGIVIMLFGAVSPEIIPLAVIQAGGVTISGIPATSAALIGVGAIIFLAGVAVYFRR